MHGHDMDVSIISFMATHAMDKSWRYLGTDFQLDEADEEDEEGNAGSEDASRSYLTSLAARIPKPAKPLFSASLRVTELCFGTLAFYYLPASIVSILLVGLELVATGVVSHFYRRKLPRKKWEGIAIVIIGSAITAFSTFEGGSSSDENYPLGLLFLLLKVLFRVPSDMLDEIFMKDCGYPPLLLLSLASIYMFILGLLFYCILVVPFAGFHVHGSLFLAMSSPTSLALMLGLMFVICLAAFFAIFSTFVTSSLTRGLWKGLQGLVVWIVGIILYYSAGRGNYGEAWVLPGSPILLAGCAVLTAGIYRYSSAATKSERANKGDTSITKEEESIEDAEDSVSIDKLRWPVVRVRVLLGMTTKFDSKQATAA
jgi:MFS family permease